MHTISIVETYMDETPQAQSIFAKETKDEAIAEYHYKMWAAMNAANVRKVVITVQNDDGGVIVTDRWARYIPPEPEPEPEPETDEVL